METGGAEGHSLSGLAGKRRDSVNSGRSGRAAARTLAKAPGVVNARGGADSPFFLKDLAPNLRSNERLNLE